MKPFVDWEVRPGFFLYLALMLLLLPFRWLLAALTAGAMHELGHLLALSFYRLPIRSIQLEAAGAKIMAESGTDKQELFYAAAGPIVGFLISLLFPWFPRLAFCAFCQSMFNLLPLMPFDGGRMLRCIMYLLFGQRKGGRIYSIAERAFCIIFFGVGLLAVRVSWILPATAGLIILRCAKNRKSMA